MDTQVKLKEAKWHGLRTLGTSSQTVNQSARTVDKDDHERAKENTAREADSGQSSLVVDVMERDDRERRYRLFTPAWWQRKLGSFRRIWGYMFPQETEEEQAARLEAKATQERFKRDKEELADMKKTIEGVFVTRGLVRTKVVNQSERIVQRPRIDRCFMSNDGNAAYFHLDMRHIPMGVGIEHFIDQGLVDHVSMSLRRQVHVDYSNELHGVVWTAELGSNSGIPREVSWVEMMEKRPSGAGPLSFPLGRSVGGRPEWRDIDDGPHWLIGGTTGYGKSTQLNSMICAILAHPESIHHVRLALVDLKRTELTHYRGVPHLLKVEGLRNGEAIVTQLEDLQLLMDYLQKELEKRQNLFEDKYRDLNAYNAAHRKNPLPRIIVIVDELGRITITDYKDDFNNQVIDMTNICRVFGIHFVLATQKPEARTIDTRITFNLDARVAFRCPTPQSSMIIMNNGDAVKLERPGQMFFSMGANQKLIQGAFISPLQIANVVSMVKSGEAVKLSDANVAPLTIHELVTWAANQNSFSLRRADVIKQFGDRLAINKLEKLMEENETKKGGQDKVFDVDGDYYVIRPAAGTLQRRLERLPDYTPVKTETDQTESDPMGVHVPEKIHDTPHGTSRASFALAMSGLNTMHNVGISRKKAGGRFIYGTDLEVDIAFTARGIASVDTPYIVELRALMRRYRVKVEERNGDWLFIGPGWQLNPDDIEEVSDQQ